jgi:digeranylgeranylglycerophospholipid reductase
MKRYDAVVVGAGPAGGMAARQIADAGFSCLMLDKRKVIGHPVQCGEGISAFALRNCGLAPKDDFIVHKVRGVKGVTPDGSIFYAGEPGYSLDRTKFDQHIVYGAVDRGAELLVETKATGVARHDGGWRVETDRGQEFAASVLVGADGPASNVARWVGWLRARRYWRALEYKFRKEDVSYDEDDWFVFYFSERYKGGYGWVFPRDDEYNVGAGGFFDDLKGSVRRLCADLRFGLDKIHGYSGGSIPNKYDLTHLAKDGVAIVGDAAGLTNPVFGGGIHPAVYSGKVAGKAAAAALVADDVAPLEAYEARMKASPFTTPILWTTAEILQRWDDYRFNYLGWVAAGGDFNDLTAGKAFVRTLRRAPRMLLEAKDLRTLQKGLSITQKYGW